MQRSTLLCTLVVFSCLLAGCDSPVNKLHNETPTLTPAPVPTDKPTATPPPTPQSGTILIENNRSAAYVVTITIVKGNLTHLTVTYQNGTKKTLTSRTFARPHSQESYLVEVDNITDVDPANGTRFSKQYRVAPHSTRSVRLPEDRTNITLLYEIKQRNVRTIVIVGVVRCKQPFPKLSYVHIQLHSRHRGGGGFGCSPVTDSAANS